MCKSKVYPKLYFRHSDGSLKFWDASAGTLQILYKLKTSKVLIIIFYDILIF